MSDHEYGPHSSGEVPAAKQATYTHDDLMRAEQHGAEREARYRKSLMEPIVRQLDWEREKVRQLIDPIIQARMCQPSPPLILQGGAQTVAASRALERTVARRCEHLARCRGDLVTAADIRREFGLEER